MDDIRQLEQKLSQAICGFIKGLLDYQSQLHVKGVLEITVDNQVTKVLVVCKCVGTSVHACVCVCVHVCLGIKTFRLLRLRDLVHRFGKMHIRYLNQLNPRCQNEIGYF